MRGVKSYRALKVTVRTLTFFTAKEEPWRTLGRMMWSDLGYHTVSLAALEH